MVHDFVLFQQGIRIFSTFSKNRKLNVFLSCLPNFQYFKICQLAKTIDAKGENITGAFYIIIIVCFFQLKNAFLACSSYFWSHASVVSNFDIILRRPLPSTHIYSISIRRLNV